jgi:DNA-directed RNA polymerase subunit alpha
LDLAIEEMEFSVRTYNALKDASIQTVQDLVQSSEGDLLDARLSPVSLREIKATLDIVGLQLRLDSNRSQKEEEE